MWTKGKACTVTAATSGLSGDLQAREPISTLSHEASGEAQIATNSSLPPPVEIAWLIPRDRIFWRALEFGTWARNHQPGSSVPRSSRIMTIPAHRDLLWLREVSPAPR